MKPLKKVFKAMLIICLKNICINKSVLVANPCPTMKISSFVPLVSELILSSADVPFSPSCMARGLFVRLGAKVKVSLALEYQFKSKDLQIMTHFFYFGAYLNQIHNMLIDFLQFTQF